MHELTTIGHYEIVRRLGKSMADVYLAIDTIDGRQVALKLIPNLDDAATRMVIEAERRGAAIQRELHELDSRVVEIYESGEMEGYFYVAMQFVEGRSLAKTLLSDQVIDPQRAAVIALEICEQLAKFHSCQSTVVHGDIKPANIHLGYNDTVHLLDFGIAKTLRADGDATGHNFGSPSYCSPERLARAEVDQHADLWALAATLYEMLAGVPPFQAENTRKLERLIRSRRPPRPLPASCPRSLRAIVFKSLSSDPSKRYQSALEFKEDLQAFLEGRAVSAESARRLRWNPTATIEAAREAVLRITRTARRGRAALQAAGAAAYFVTGMFLWIVGTMAWQAWQARASEVKPPATAAPVESMAGFYIAAADRILESYRSSSDPWLFNFDWQKAEICLERAIALGNGEDQTAGKLALSRGYATLERLNGAHYSEHAAAQLRQRIRGDFTIAAAKLPSDPLPHLALARVYAYELSNPERAAAEFAAAERLGAPLGLREIEQQGDAYRIHAEREFASDWRQAVRDAGVARTFYERARGFNEVDEHLRALDKIHAPIPRPPKVRRTYLWR